MTILLRPAILPVKAPMLTLVMALSVSEGIRKTTGLECGIKWPNDIVTDGCKICGILTEMSSEIDFINYVVTGVGINVNAESFPEEIAAKATSLKIKLGTNVSRSALVADIMERFEENYAAFLETEDLSLLMERYNALLVNRGKEVRVLEPGNEYNAYSSGISQTGELLVTAADGSLKKIYAGEVSVRGVYGYV